MQFDQLKRREFITLLGGAAGAWPFAARAQRFSNLKTIGFLGEGTPSSHGPLFAAFVQRLRELGWVEGHTVAIELRWGEGRNERFAEFAAEFVRLKVDIIVASGTANVLAAKQATAVIPIVIAAAGNPIGSGLVASLAQPGGNVTGLSTQAADLAGKRLEFLREVIPGPGRLAIMGNVANPSVVLEMGELKAAARALSLEIAALEIQKTQDIVPAFEALKGRADALYVVVDALVAANWIRINTLALGARLPTMSGGQGYVEMGGLISYGPNGPALFRRAADYLDKILRGAKPGDLPIEQPTKFDLVMNLVTARALGLTIPESLLARADEVIE
jgi:putative tryptophan/tyrosine transport system substrate-binding protein